MVMSFDMSCCLDARSTCYPFHTQVFSLTYTLAWREMLKKNISLQILNDGIKNIEKKRRGLDRKISKKEGNIGRKSERKKKNE